MTIIGAIEELEGSVESPAQLLLIVSSLKMRIFLETISNQQHTDSLRFPWNALCSLQTSKTNSSA